MEDDSHPKSPQHVTDDNDLENIAPPPKRSKNKKKSKKKSTVVVSDSSSESDVHVTSKKEKLAVASQNAMVIDSEIEEIPNSKESSEDELGE